MEFASAVGLKAEAQEKILRPLLASAAERGRLGIPSRSVSGRRPPVPRALALGISAQAGGPGNDQYRLAVRVQHPLLRDSPVVNALHAMSRGEIDVGYIGSVHRLGGLPWYQSRSRPLQIGASIGHISVTAGTIGGFVEDGRRGPAILSNNHVLAAENQGAIGDPILQPGAVDDAVTRVDRVATLTRFIPLHMGGVNSVDAAIACLESGVAFDDRAVRGVGRLRGVRTRPLAVNEEMLKVGRTSGETRGRVTAVDVDSLLVCYDHGDAIFNGQIEIEGDGAGPFCLPGDSGSLVLDQVGRGAGLAFAASDFGGKNGAGLSYANPLPTVLSALNVRLL